MYKRVFTLSMVIFLCLGIVGCVPAGTAGGDSQPPAASASTSAAPAVTTTAAVSTAQASESETRELVTLRWLGGTEKFDPMAELERERIKEILGIDIQAELGADADKISLVLASGEEYDVIKTGDRTVLSQVIANRSSQPLNASMDKTGNFLREYISEDRWAMFQDGDGNIYALPNLHYNAVTTGVAVRENWLKAAEMDPPGTPEELYDFLVAVKALDPGGVGAQMIPFSFANADLKLNGLAQAFGIGDGPSSFIVENDELKFSMEQPGFKDYMLFLQKLFKENLLDPDFVVNTGSTLQEKIGAGNMAAVHMDCWGYDARIALKQVSADNAFVFCEPFQDANGARNAVSIEGLEQFVIVPRVSKKVDDVVRFANEFLNPEYYSSLIIGDEGVHWQWEGEKRVPIMPAFNDLNMARWFFPVNASDLYAELFPVRAWKVYEMGEMWEDLTGKANQYSYKDPIAFAPAIPEAMELNKSLTDLLREKLNGFIIDGSQTEANLDKIIEDYLNAGGSTYIQLYKDWYAGTKE